MNDKKFYWLKLKTDFFKRHDIRIITGLPDGDRIVLFYLRIMLESVDHEGELRFSEDRPYTPEMLATITDTKIEIVKKAMEVLKDFGLIQINEEGTIILPKVMGMIDSASDSDSARRQKRYRERKKSERNETLCENVTHVTNVTTKSNERYNEPSREIEIEKEIEIDKRNSKEKKFQPPTLEEVKSYCLERKSNVDPVKFYDYYSTGNWKDSKGNPVKNWKQKLITWEKKNETATAPQPIPQKKSDWISDYYERAGMIAPREGGASNDT